MNDLNEAVFLDRDGVINMERPNYVKTLDELEIFPDVAESIKQLKRAGYLIVVITNQSAVNRGLINHDNINNIHATIQKFLQESGTSVDAFYYCPHKPDENCDCRKPKPGLLLKASKELKIDLSRSWMIGDNDTDIQAAQLAGCKAFKIGHDQRLDEVVESILNSKNSSGSRR